MAISFYGGSGASSLRGSMYGVPKTPDYSQQIQALKQSAMPADTTQAIQKLRSQAQAFARPGGGAAGTATLTMGSAGGGKGSVGPADPAVSQQQRANEEMALTSSPEAGEMAKAIAGQQQLTENYRAKMDQNVQRYKDLALKFQERKLDLTNYLDQMGQQEKDSIESRRAEVVAGLKEDLYKRGITSEDALAAAVRGINNQASRSVRDFEERFAIQKLGHVQELSADSLAAGQQSIAAQAEIANKTFEARMQGTQGMRALADMLAQERMAGWQTQAELRKSLISNQSYKRAADLRYAEEMETLASRSEIDMLNLQLDKEMGYAALQNKSAISQIQQKLEADLAQVQKTAAYNQQNPTITRFVSRA